MSQWLQAHGAPVEQALPADLDQPLSAFDPGAVPEVPIPAPEEITPDVLDSVEDDGDDAV